MRRDFGRKAGVLFLAAARSKAASVLWAVCACGALALLWQEALGWPLHKRVTLGGAAFSLEAPGLVEARLRDRLSVWQSAFIELREGGELIQRWPDRRELSSAVGPGWFLGGRSVHLRPRDLLKLEARAERVTVTVPWQLPPALGWQVAGALTILTLALLALGNPDLHRLLNPSRTGDWEHWSRWCLLGLAIVSLVAAAWIRERAFSFPIITPDTFQYLEPGIDFLASGKLHSQPDRPFGYPLVLGLILRCRPDLRAVLQFHEAASLLAGAVLAFLLWSYGAVLFQSPILRFAAGLLGIAAMVLFTCNEAILQREWLILPEASAAVYLALQLLLLRGLLARPEKMLRSCVVFALFCGAGWMLCLSKPNWGLALLCLPMPWICAAFRGSGTALQQPRWWMAGAAIFLGTSILALIAERATLPLAIGGSFEIRGRALVSWHAPLIRQEIERRLASAQAVPYRDTLMEIRQIIDDEFALAAKEGPGAYVRLGYDGDRLFYDGFARAASYHQLSPERQAALCRSLFLSAVCRHPLVYLAKVLRQMEIPFVSPYGFTQIFRSDAISGLEYSSHYLERTKGIPAPIRESYDGELAEAGAGLPAFPSAVRRGCSVRMAIIYEGLKRCFGWTLALPGMVFILAGLIPAWRRAIDWRRLLPVLCAGTWAIGSIVFCALTSATAQALEIQRYIDLFWPLSLFAELLWPLIAVALLAALVSPSRGGEPSAPDSAGAALEAPL